MNMDNPFAKKYRIDLPKPEMPRLFVDMDGVLADFDTGYRNLFGDKSDKELDNVDWKRIRDHGGFFESLPPMHDFDHIWQAVEPFNPTIITGCPEDVEEAYANKLAWVHKNIGTHISMIGCKSRDKCLYGKPGDILIDDWEKYMHLWRGMGGHWITHISAESSVKQLHEHLEGLCLNS